MSLNRGRLIIGERPAPDVVQCMRCRRKWDAHAHTGFQCLVCKVHWDQPPEWDRTVTLRKLWVIESRWRIGFGHGRWQHVTQLPGEHSPEEIHAMIVQYEDIERERCARLKATMRFEYRVSSSLIEVYNKSAARVG